jgi:hypothetical protein
VGYAGIMICKPGASGDGRHGATLKTAEAAELAAHRERVRQAMKRVIEASGEALEMLARLLATGCYRTDYLATGR